MIYGKRIGRGNWRSWWRGEDGARIPARLLAHSDYDVVFVDRSEKLYGC